MVKCTKCLMPAIMYQNYSGLHLCKTHFFEDVERKFKLTIRNEYKIKKNDRLIVALSGGKDSSLVLYLLAKFFLFRKDIKIIAVTIDEGIENYRNLSIKKSIEFTKKLNIEHKIFSFIEEYKITMDQLVKSKKICKCISSKSNNKSKGPCSYCGVLRKKLLNKIAKKLNGTKLVIGHNLDDESQTIMLNYLSGDITKMTYISNKTDKDGFVNRMKPLKKIPEQEVGLYAYLKNMPMELSPCPYTHSALRKEVRRLLNYFDLNHPGTKYSLLNGFDSISKYIDIGENINSKEIKYCKYCNEPSNNSICQACCLLYEL